MTTSTSRLESIPQEVLEHIAFCAATQSLVGPPSGLLPLLLTCRNIYQTVSFGANPYLYAHIFSSKFDTRSVFRRLGSHISAPRVLANELKKRWIHLKRIRARTNSRIRDAESPPTGQIDLLWFAYLMMLENDGKNERQLLDYAEMDVWLLEYWFDDDGASCAAHMLLHRSWPVESAKNSIAMWLFWFLLRPDFITRAITRTRTRTRHMISVVKLTALAANHYPICRPSWAEYLPRSGEATISPSFVTHFSGTYQLNPPTLAPTAILAFSALALQLLLPTQGNYAMEYSFRSPASFSSTTRRSEEWDTAWYRCINPSKSDRCRTISEIHALGSLDGVWEGLFVYTEFDSYALLLSGGSPSVLEQSLIAHHRQTWKLREYVLAENQEPNGDKPRPLGPGDPLRAHFPRETRVQELRDSIEVQEPGRDAVRYWRPSNTKPDDHKVMDIIIMGEGHSAWGQFSLFGRVRPLDGLISLSKQYVEGDRGRWLYRGYLVGNVDGYISGRWRDTLSPSDVEGYEGCFAMARRR